MKRLNYSNKFLNIKMVALWAIILLVIGCKDDSCYCDDMNLSTNAHGECICSSEKYQLGTSNKNCNTMDQSINKGFFKCLDKNENNYLMIIEEESFPCTPISTFDSAVVNFCCGNPSVFHKVNIGTLSGSKGIIDYYNRKPDGIEFRIINIRGFAVNERLSEYYECQGHPGGEGFMKGKFNPDNTYCETYIYWYDTPVPDANDIPIDSTKVILMK